MNEQAKTIICTDPPPVGQPSCVTVVIVDSVQPVPAIGAEGLLVVGIVLLLVGLWIVARGQR